MRSGRRAAARGWRHSASAAAWASRWSSMSPLPEAVRISAAVLDAIAAHARAAAPQECCGLLIGVGDEIVEAVATTNVAADPVRHYEIAPIEYVTQIRRCRTLAASEGRGYAVI